MLLKHLQYLSGIVAIYTDTACKFIGYPCNIAKEFILRVHQKLIMNPFK